MPSPYKRKTTEGKKISSRQDGSISLKDGICEFEIAIFTGEKIIDKAFSNN